MLGTAGRALKLVQANYAASLATYPAAQIADIQARAARFQDIVALFAALDGGWWNAPQPAGDLPPKV